MAIRFLTLESGHTTFFFFGGRVIGQRGRTNICILCWQYPTYTYTYLQANIYVKYTHKYPSTPYCLYIYNINIHIYIHIHTDIMYIRLAWKTFFWQGELEKPSIICAKRALYVRSTSCCSRSISLLWQVLTWLQYIYKHVRSMYYADDDEFNDEILMSTMRQMNDTSEFNKR